MSLDAIGIVSRNPETSVQFYALLGVELAQTGGPDHFEGRTPTGVRIMVDSIGLVRRLYPLWQEPTGSGVVLCFAQSDAEQVDSLYEKILSGGYRSFKAPWDAFWGQRYASVLDPDGNQIDLFAPLSS
jgi:catechol 2,3-dioxygenase-like lactoylglutathione lyase family enzyme